MARARAPVATMMCFACSVVFSPTFCPSMSVLGSMAILPPPWSVAAPMNTSTLFFFMRNLTPPFILFATPRERATTAGQSAVGAPSPIERPVVGEVGELAHHLGGLDERLCRNAANVQADAAELVLLDDGGLEAELVGADGGFVTAGAGADDDDVVGLVCHESEGVG